MKVNYLIAGRLVLQGPWHAAATQYPTEYNDDVTVVRRWQGVSLLFFIFNLKDETGDWSPFHSVPI